MPGTIMFNTFVHTTGAYASQTKQTDDLFGQLAELSLFSGVVTVAKNGKVVYSKGFGSPFFEYDVPMPSDAVFPIGSNTK